MKEIIEQILAIEKEQKLRKSLGVLEDYNTGKKVHKKQLAFHKCKKKNKEKKDKE